MSDTVYMLEMYDSEYTLPVGIFSRRELAEQWARENAEACGLARGPCEGTLDWAVKEYIINSPDASWVTGVI